MTINFTTLFNKLRPIKDAFISIDTYRGTTAKTELEAILSPLGTELGDADTGGMTFDTIDAWKQLRDDPGYKTELKALAETIIIETIDADAGLSEKTIEEALAELHSQMDGASETVEDTTANIVITPPDADAPELFYTDLAVLPNYLFTRPNPETITGKVSGSTLVLKGQPEAPSNLSAQYPMGSGGELQLGVTKADDGVVSGGLNEEDPARSSTPKGWLVQDGVIDTDIKLTTVEVQTVAISGSPTSGTYVLSFTNADGDELDTEPLPYDASGSQVQQELRKLDGLSAVTVSSAGSSPNYTHTVTFKGVGGDLALLAVKANTTGATITPAESTAGDTVVRSGRTLVFVGDGATQHHIRQRISLKASTNYVFRFFSAISNLAATGTMAVRVVDGSGTILQSNAGSSWTINKSLSGYGTANTFEEDGSANFSTPTDLPDVLYLEIYFSTALSNTHTCYVEDILLAELQEFTPGLKFLLAENNRELQSDDEYTVAITKGDTGEFWDWFVRLWDWRLPSDDPHTIAD